MSRINLDLTKLYGQLNRCDQSFDFPTAQNLIQSYNHFLATHDEAIRKGNEVDEELLASTRQVVAQLQQKIDASQSTQATATSDQWFSVDASTPKPTSTPYPTQSSHNPGGVPPAPHHSSQAPMAALAATQGFLGEHHAAAREQAQFTARSYPVPNTTQEKYTQHGECHFRYSPTQKAVSNEVTQAIKTMIDHALQTGYPPLLLQASSPDFLDKLKQHCDERNIAYKLPQSSNTPRPGA